ncbi:YbhB/YbcL family Raf kinase inhibitor-like protein [Archangium sp.]|uniref:YbhB/YbcL family Raf kinase inhibitor-like protein n=1 Tax=Archangium sp. TaxID=1872627 RepID=UPI002D2988DA|nr:YbhB/YbcL family Raf kinase inhibitor-like protein [Archangium sp.]HYO55999.1 YbhB/YbcL family Raf kinase inhibitor-like protein [Archangium sp.]
MPFVLTSPDFEEGGAIPRRFTCEGEDLMPAFAWNEPPPGTRSFALLVEDPDDHDLARPWVHWIVYNLPDSARALPRGGPLPAGAREGLNDWKQPGYRGPCPPRGYHTYVHRLFALDTPLPEGAPLDRPALLALLEGHVLAEARLRAGYQKERAG